MNRTGLTILGASVAIAALLLFLWLLGAIAGIGGALIHLLLVLALLVGSIGGITGLIITFTGKKG